MAQVYAQQAAAAGINAKLRQVTVTDFYGPNYLKWVFAQDFWYYRPTSRRSTRRRSRARRSTRPTSTTPSTSSLYNQGLATLDVSKRTEIAHEMQMIDYNEGGYIIPFFPARDRRILPERQRDRRVEAGASFNSWDFEHMWVS